MKITKKLLAFAAITAMAFFTVSCGEEHDHDHQDGDGHDHDKKEEPAKTSSATYPLKNCVVSGEPLGSMGDAVTLVHEGTTVKFCCDSCIPKFKKDPAKFIAKLK